MVSLGPVNNVIIVRIGAASATCKVHFQSTPPPV
jgi:hypothetical protein